MLFVLAAGLLLVAVALLILRPLLAPDTEVAPADGTHVDLDPDVDPDADAASDTATDADTAEGARDRVEASEDPLEAAIAARRAAMAAREGGRR